MTKEKVFEILMQANHEDLAPVAAVMKEQVPYSVIKKPAEELVMFRAEETVEKLDFNVGEVLTTSAEVRVKDTIGYSMVIGMNKELALDCALLMGIYEAGLPQKSEIEELAQKILIKIEKQMREEREIVSSTRVNFEVMGGQDPAVSHNKPLEERDD